MRMEMLAALRERTVLVRYPLAVLAFALTTLSASADWQIYGKNAQHSSQSNVEVDRSPRFCGIRQSIIILNLPPTTARRQSPRQTRSSFP